MIFYYKKNIFLQKMLHVSTLKAHHQERMNKKECSQIPF